MWRLLLTIFVSLCTIAPVSADSWAPPEVATTYSSNERFRFVSQPRDIRSRLAYFEAKAAGKDLPPGDPASGRLERLTGAVWETVWTTNLANEVAPVSAFISDDGKYVVTLDNWHSVGFGENVIVIYGGDGKLVRSLRLDQVIPAYFMEALPRSVSSLSWRAAEPRFDGDKLELAVSDIGDDENLAAFRVRISLFDGAVDPIPPEILTSVKPRYCRGHIRVVRQFNEWTAYERADLAPLADRNKDVWPRYQSQVVQRLSDGKVDAERYGLDNDPFELLPKGEYMYKDFRDTFTAALQARAEEMPVRWFSSRDLIAMTAEIERTAKKIKPDQLRGVELHFLTDKTHWPRIKSALTGSGADLIFADISVPIPQRPERLAELPPDRAVDPDCKEFW